MRFTNALRLLMGNFKQVCRLLAYKLIVLLVFCALCSAFVLPELIGILENSATKTLSSDINEMIGAMGSFSLELTSQSVAKVFGENGSLSGFIGLLLKERVGIMLVLVACVVVYLVKVFADTLVHFTMGSMINDRMSMYSETPMGTAFVKNLGKAVAYASVFVPIDFLIGSATLALVYLALRFLPFFLALFLSVTFIVFVNAFKMTLIGSWMPKMTTDNKSIKEAIMQKDAYEKKMRSKTFMLYLVTTYIVIVVNVLAMTCTFGSALILTIPASYLFFMCEQYVNYYTVKGKKYFITYENIATNADHGDSSNFFEYIKETENQETEEIESKIM